MNPLSKYNELKTLCSPHEAKLIIAHVLGIKLCDIFMFNQMELNAIQNAAIDEYAKKLREGIPIQYVLSCASFFGRDFYVDRDVLIPRFDTEILCEYAVRLIKERGYKTVLDMCCGSGCIGITLALETDISLTMSDVSKKALIVAEKNARLLKCGTKLIQSDLFENICEKYHMIVANPPYIPTYEYETLDLRFEPKLALLGGADGLYYIDEIIRSAKFFLEDGGVLLMEIGYNQGERALNIFKRHGYVDACAFDDYNGLNRIVMGFTEHDR